MNRKVDEIQWKHAEAVCNSRLIELGYETFIPFSGGGEIDLIAVKDGEVKRIQIKSTIPKNDKLDVKLYRTSINYKSSSYKPYDNIDWFLIYDGSKVYKINRSEVNINVTLRFSKPKNNQSKGVKMASDYLF